MSLWFFFIFLLSNKRLIWYIDSSGVFSCNSYCLFDTRFLNWIWGFGIGPLNIVFPITCVFGRYIEPDGLEMLLQAQNSRPNSTKNKYSFFHFLHFNIFTCPLFYKVVFKCSFIMLYFWYFIHLLCHFPNFYWQTKQNVLNILYYILN